MIIENSDFRAYTGRMLKKVEKFLGISDYNWSDVALSPVFEGMYEERLDSRTWKILSEYYESSNQKLFDLIGNQYSWNKEAE